MKLKFWDKEKDTPNSEVFWTAALAVALIVSGIINCEVLCIIETFLSAFALIALFFGEERDTRLWMVLTPTFWIIGLFAMATLGLLSGCEWIHKHTIKRFNNWLNEK